MFEWKPEYSVSISKFDREHRELFRLAETIHKAALAGSSHEILGSLLADLVAYAREHFVSEEEILESSGYPELAQHKREHLDLASRMTQLQQQFEAGKSQLGPDLMELLHTWGTGHILNIDMPYGDYLNRLGVY